MIHFVPVSQNTSPQSLFICEEAPGKPGQGPILSSFRSIIELQLVGFIKVGKRFYFITDSVLIWFYGNYDYDVYGFDFNIKQVQIVNDQFSFYTRKKIKSEKLDKIK